MSINDIASISALRPFRQAIHNKGDEKCQFCTKLESFFGLSSPTGFGGSKGLAGTRRLITLFTVKHMRQEITRGGIDELAGEPGRLSFGG